MANTKLPFNYGWAGGISGSLGAAPAPVFDVDFGTGSIVPTIGSAGTFSRAGATLMAGKTTLTSVATNTPLVEAFPPGATFTEGGIQISGAVKNYLLRSNEFDSALVWVPIGTGSVVANSTTGPQGASTADTLVGGAALDGVEQDTGTAAASFSMVFTVWLRADTGSRSVTITLHDTGSTQTASTVCTVTTAWKQFKVSRMFTSGAVGNIFANIAVGDTTGYSIFASEAFATDFNGATTAGLPTAFNFTPNITTTSATVTKALDDLRYAGAEVIAGDSKISWIVWFYIPSYSSSDLNNAFNIFSNYTNAWGRMQGARARTSDDTIQVYWGDDAVISTALTWNKNAFNMLALTVNYTTNSHTVSINGGARTTNSNVYAARATTALCVGNKDTSPTTATCFGSIIGRITRYNVALTLGEEAAIYAGQKGNYGL